MDIIKKIDIIQPFFPIRNGFKKKKGLIKIKNINSGMLSKRNNEFFIEKLKEFPFLKFKETYKNF